MNMQMVVIIVYFFLYGKLYLSLSGLEAAIMKQALMRGNNPLKAAMASQSAVQLGLLMALPMVMEIGLERGFRTALGDIIIMQLQLCSVFFTFSLGTKSHYFGRTVLHGGAKYRATGRGFVVRHVKFAENYRMYSRSHFTKGLELMLLLIVYQIYGSAATDSTTFMLLTASMWFLVTTWLFAPFLFNPSGFEWQKIVDDWEDWSKWINSRGGIGVPANKSWESWWEEEQEHLSSTRVIGRFCEIVLSLRFFVFQYGIVYHLHVSNNNKSLIVSPFTASIFRGEITTCKIHTIQIIVYYCIQGIISSLMYAVISSNPNGLDFAHNNVSSGGKIYVLEQKWRAKRIYKWSHMTNLSNSYKKYIFFLIKLLRFCSYQPFKSPVLCGHNPSIKFYLSFQVYALSWLVIVAVMLVLKVRSVLNNSRLLR